MVWKRKEEIIEHINNRSKRERKNGRWSGFIKMNEKKTNDFFLKKKKRYRRDSFLMGS